MAKYLRTSSITAELENLIREAKKELYIISPYLKLSDNMKELLNDKEREKVDVRIIFGKQELAPTEMSYLEKLKYVRLYFSKNLHAKCYLNENKMIIASMNLYEFSQQHNREMGILIDTENEEDKQVYEDASSDIESIMHNSEDFSYIQAPQKTITKDKETERNSETNNSESTKRYLNSKLLTTKELSQKTGLSSRKVNSWFVDHKLMYKKDDDWFATKKGYQFGAKQLEGAYGKFIIWPEELANEIKE
ncbi:MAG: phospholipase D family protein [Muricauda sp.]|nr:phospholipase D family protein [Allomuricauda sp.]MBO6532921.1 phospholipase D family protein [Allomuricauda sp.]MBO6587507.1 phospholipase D family protein [Allomuricauda sp.]MBO6617132.1 phospholipase D family protein [Allomuricauda sp.]MBO6643857.1 phospholipase D family protein [Allomuricauda sp.]MBO6745467.1 phospholipase D family protein [Allomuricauda sp.]